MIQNVGPRDSAEAIKPQARRRTQLEEGHHAPNDGVQIAEDRNDYAKRVTKARRSKGAWIFPFLFRYKIYRRFR